VKYVRKIRWLAFLFLTIILTLSSNIYADSWSINPAFEDHTSGSTSLINMLSFAEESKLGLKTVGDGPAQVSYMISVTPVNGSEAAIGTVRTDFRGSIYEARGINQNVSETNEWRDHSMVSGYIKNFMKSFSYISGIST
jgi:hypothetical protein